jgi:type I restriction enzyme S subunit
MSYKRIGDFIELVDERNKDLSVTNLLGLSISKQFIPSVANTIGTNMKTYKIIRKNQFACSVMQVRRDGKMPVALLKEFDEAIISQAYPVFQVIEETELLPEYLMMWFTRSEFDREATFHAVGGVRGSLEWEDFLDFELPIPSIEKQQQIVVEYNTVTNRINLNNKLNQKLEETAQALYKHWFVDFEFPAHLSGTLSGAEGYKSSGGEMVFNEELEKEIPVGWSVKRMKEISKITMGQSPKGESYNENELGTPLINGPVEFGNYFTVKTKWTTDPKKYCGIDDLILCVRGSTVGKYVMADDNYSIGRGVCSINSKYPFFNRHMVQSNLNEILKDVTGSTFPNLDRQTLESYLIVMSENHLMKAFENSCSSLFKTVKFRFKENQTLQELQSLLLAKMTKVELEKKPV